jgi:hypothetical protein
VALVCLQRKLETADADLGTEEKELLEALRSIPSSTTPSLLLASISSANADDPSKKR